MAIENEAIPVYTQFGVVSILGFFCEKFRVLGKKTKIPPAPFKKGEP
ncbi:MAG: hypothetical protein IID18_10680 [Nitrospinae bacterium]|nr:hypothetical protein [Nitrospinota bacterium]